MIRFLLPFVIITDGFENAGRMYANDPMKAMVERQKEEYGREFIFLGANKDAVESVFHFGIQEDRAVTFRYDPRGQT